MNMGVINHKLHKDVLDHNNPISDCELWNSFKSGDHLAFKSIYFDYYYLLYQYALNISKDETVSIDVIQDLFSDLWDSRNKLGKVLSIKAYLLSSLRRRVLQKLKQKRRKQVLALELFTFAPDLEFSPEILMIQREKDLFRQSIVRQALNELSKRQKEVVYLRFFLDVSYMEVAQVMGIQYQSVLNHYQAALKKLRSNGTLLKAVSWGRV